MFVSVLVVLQLVVVARMGRKVRERRRNVKAGQIASTARLSRGTQPQVNASPDHG